LAGRLFWRTKYFRPFGSVAVRTAAQRRLTGKYRRGGQDDDEQRSGRAGETRLHM
jgi:hypothetical protein